MLNLYILMKIRLWKIKIEEWVHILSLIMRQILLEVITIYVILTEVQTKSPYFPLDPKVKVIELDIDFSIEYILKLRIQTLKILLFL